jgi:hypothetical protein
MRPSALSSILLRFLPSVSVLVAPSSVSEARVVAPQEAVRTHQVGQNQSHGGESAPQCRSPRTWRVGGRLPASTDCGSRPSITGTVGASSPPCEPVRGAAGSSLRRPTPARPWTAQASSGCTAWPLSPGTVRCAYRRACCPHELVRFLSHLLEAVVERVAGALGREPPGAL